MSNVFSVVVAVALLALAVGFFIRVSLRVRRGGGSSTTLLLGSTYELHGKDRRKAIEVIVEKTAGRRRQTRASTDPDTEGEESGLEEGVNDPRSRLVRIADVRPNNWYINEEKLNRIREVWSRGAQADLPPVLVSEIDGEQSLIDGHARTYAAHENGSSEILAVVEKLDEIGGSRELYEHIHREGPRIGIRTIGDLASRIVPPEEHERLWIDYCRKWLERSENDDDV